MRILDIKLSDWKNVDHKLNDIGRYWREEISQFRLNYSSYIEIHASIKRIYWGGKFYQLQTIFDQTYDLEYFFNLTSKEQMELIDQFLITMNKMKAFI